MHAGDINTLRIYPRLSLQKQIMIFVFYNYLDCRRNMYDNLKLQETDNFSQVRLILADATKNLTNIVLEMLSQEWHSIRFIYYSLCSHADDFICRYCTTNDFDILSVSYQYFDGCLHIDFFLYLELL